MSSKTELGGWLFGAGAFIWWGFVPIYFKAVDTVPAQEILSMRVIWCIPVTFILMWFLKKPVLLKQLFTNRQTLFALITSTAMICGNWYVFTWAVTHEQILATSLGYFINPVLSILLGVVFLSEKLTRMQWAAVACVFLGVANQVINYGEVPWISLGLAATFAVYGFIRKQLPVDALNGLLAETIIALPFALVYMLLLFVNEKAVFLNGSWFIDLLLMGGGVITAVPLILFAAAARIIPLNSMGFLQFLAPSITFVVATQYYNEPLGAEQMMSFLFIWLALILYLSRPLKVVFNARKIKRDNS